jgi:hypothetical protein
MCIPLHSYLTPSTFAHVSYHRNERSAELVTAETMRLNQHRNKYEHLQQAGKIRKQT